MANIKMLLANLLSTESAQELMPPAMSAAEGRFDRIDHDLNGLSDADAMWYYERRKWQGRD